jgi:hypothetical protein
MRISGLVSTTFPIICFASVQDLIADAAALPTASPMATALPASFSHSTHPL